ncbi:MAG: T9SS type A sorting domain-containing protein [Flavobacteriales bacterium]|nr:T9SS type A sorting domain-containing protein [Flavobacteriales bacterium]
MKSTEAVPFGTHLNLYAITDEGKSLIHQQQVVVPSSNQNPYAQVWLPEQVTVDHESEYVFEVEIPDGRQIEFFHSDIEGESNFEINGIKTPAHLAFEMGIAKPVKSLFKIRESVRSNVQPWELNIPDDYACLTMQRYLSSSAVYDGNTITQTFTACQDGVLDQLFLNATIQTNNQSDPSASLTILNEEGQQMAQADAIWNANYDYLKFDFAQNLLAGGATYTLKIDVADNTTITLNTVDVSQYFVGQMTIDGSSVAQNVCFMGLMQNAPVVDEPEEDMEVDHNIYDNYDQWDHEFYHEKPTYVEKLRHKVYPNPFVSEFNVKVETEAQIPGVITLYNFMGKKVFERNVEDMSSVNEVAVNPTEELTIGYYTLRIEYGDDIILDTVVKQ